MAWIFDVIGLLAIIALFVALCGLASLRLDDE